jgi:hypothetical protein
MLEDLIEGKNNNQNNDYYNPYEGYYNINDIYNSEILDNINRLNRF